MKTPAFFVFFGLLVLGTFGSPTQAAASDKLAIAVNDAYTFFAIPFSLSHTKSQVVVPKTASRDATTSTSVGYTLKTPEGLRQHDGRAVGMVVKDKKATNYVLYVLYQDSTPPTRVNTLAITHLPFLLVNEKTGTSSQQLNQSELRHFVVKNPNMKPLTDTE